MEIVGKGRRDRDRWHTSLLEKTERKRERAREEEESETVPHLSEHPSTHLVVTFRSDMEATAPSNAIVLEFKEDIKLTEVRFLL